MGLPYYAWLVVLLPLFYILSAGPARAFDWRKLPPFVDAFYAPLGYSYAKSHLVRQVLDAYFILWGLPGAASSSFSFHPCKPAFIRG
jgi:hypothetical protein